MSRPESSPTPAAGKSGADPMPKRPDKPDDPEVAAVDDVLEALGAGAVIDGDPGPGDDTGPEGVPRGEDHAPGL